MRAKASKGTAARTGRAKFDETKHRRGGRGNKGRFANQAGKGDDAPKRTRKPTAAEQSLKNSGVGASDRIVVLSSRSRRYQGFETVGAFVDAHPRGRAYALRAMAADHANGRIGFSAAGGAASATATAAKPGARSRKTSGIAGEDAIVLHSARLRSYREGQTVGEFVANHPQGHAYALRKLAADHRAGRIGFAAGERSGPVQAQDDTLPGQIPRPGTPERRFHDGLLEAAGVFGPQARLKASYYFDGRPAAFSVDTGSVEDIIQRSVNVYRGAGTTRSVDHDLFMLGDGNRPPGQAKRFLAKSIEAYRHIGIAEVNVHADINVGGYAWLKYGFKPDELSAGDLARHAMGKATALREAGAIDAKTFAHLKRALDGHDFHAAVDIGGATKIRADGKNQSLGKHLFLGSDWTGKLDLYSPPDMARFNAYVRGAE